MGLAVFGDGRGVALEIAQAAGGVDLVHQMLRLSAVDGLLDHAHDGRGLLRREHVLHPLADQVGPVGGQQLLVAAEHVQIGAVAVEQEAGVGQGTEDGLQAFLGGVDLVLDGIAPGHVLEHHDHAQGPAVLVHDGRGAVGDLVFGAVPRDQGGVVGQADHHALAQDPAHRMLGGLAGECVDDVEDLDHGVAQGLAAAPAGHALGDRVHARDQSLQIGHQDRVADRVQGHREALLALFQRLGGTGDLPRHVLHGVGQVGDIAAAAHVQVQGQVAGGDLAGRLFQTQQRRGDEARQQPGDDRYEQQGDAERGQRLVAHLVMQGLDGGAAVQADPERGVTCFLRRRARAVGDGADAEHVLARLLDLQGLAGMRRGQGPAVGADPVQGSAHPGIATGGQDLLLAVGEYRPFDLVVQGDVADQGLQAVLVVGLQGAAQRRGVLDVEQAQQPGGVVAQFGLGAVQVVEDEARGQQQQGQRGQGRQPAVQWKAVYGAWRAHGWGRNPGSARWPMSGAPSSSRQRRIN